MGIKSLKKERVVKMSMIELANMIMSEEKKEMNFKTLFEKVTTLKKWDDTIKQDKISQFYTDLNADGRFITQGSNVWGLKKWYRKGKGGKLVADESQLIDRKEQISELIDEDDADYEVKATELELDEDEVDESIDEDIDEYDDEDDNDYYELGEELKDEFAEEFGDEEDDDY